jgi:Mrp family chromosome partitioning ATPase
VADPNIWIANADAALLVVRQGKTPKRLLLKTLQEATDLKLLGIVMNGSQDVSHQYYAQYYRTNSHANSSRSRHERQLLEK